MILNESSRNLLLFFFGGDFYWCVISYLCNSDLKIIIVTLILIYNEFNFNMHAICVLSFTITMSIPLKITSKDVTGAHWSRAITPKKKDIMVCRPEKYAVLVLCYAFTVDSQSSGT